jgi:peptide/nickel transport system permease protein
MRTYIIRRLILIIPTLLVATMTVFAVIRFIPGSVIEMMVDEREAATGQTLEDIKRSLGLDVPIHIQYVRWVSDIVLRGDFGKSMWRGTPVAREIAERVPVTIELGTLAIFFAWIVAIPVGVYSAMRQDTVGDYIGRSFAILNLAVPGFWLGTMVVVFPALWWDWSPSVRLIRFTDDPLGNLGMFIVPALIMGMSMSATTMRMTRTMMLEVLRNDYIRTAWAKGLRERVVIVRHALKNALIPIVTIFGMQIEAIVGGAVIMEQIFGLPGLGRMMLDGINARDYPIVSAVMVFVAIVVLTMNLIVDLTYGFLDPRMKYRYR